MTITIKDIAKMAGVSYATVSKALNNNPEVKPSTREKVLEIADRLGYQPNIIAKSLVSRKSNILGGIWPTVDRAFLSTLATHINEQLSDKSYNLLLSINSIDSAIQLFNQIHVDGILIFDNEKLSMFPKYLTSRVPILCYGEADAKGFHSVLVDRRKAMYMAVEYLWNLGHRKICFIGDLRSSRYSQQDKYLGFLDGIKNFGLESNTNMFIDSRGLNTKEGYVATKQLLDSAYHPTAIVASSYDLTVGITHALREVGKSVPEDISIISYDNIPQMSNLDVSITSVGGPVKKIAKLVVDSIIGLMDDDSETPKTQYIEPELTIRQSCLDIR